MFYINIGVTEPGDLAPMNMSHNAVSPFQLVGPSNDEYDGQFCLPQVGMPKNLDLQVGANITIQVIELAQHGAALYNVCLPFPACTGCVYKAYCTVHTGTDLIPVRRRNPYRTRRS